MARSILVRVNSKQPKLRAWLRAYATSIPQIVLVQSLDCSSVPRSDTSARLSLRRTRPCLALAPPPSWRRSRSSRPWPRPAPPPGPLARRPQVRGAGHVRSRQRLRGQPAASRGRPPRPSKCVLLPVLPRQPRRCAPRQRRRYGLLLLASGRGLAVGLRRLHRAGLRGGAAAVRLCPYYRHAMVVVDGGECSVSFHNLQQREESITSQRSTTTPCLHELN